VVEDAVETATEPAATAQPGDSPLSYLGSGELSSSKILPQIPNGSTISVSGLGQQGLCGGCAPHESLSLGGCVLFKE
jgi:hypothetical protein